MRLHLLELDLQQPATLQIWLKRKKNKALSRKITVERPTKAIQIDDSVRVSAKCRLREGRFDPFEASLYVVLYPLSSDGQTAKNAGTIEKIDLTQILMPTHPKVPASKQLHLRLEKSTPNASITLTLSSTFIR